MNDREKEQIMQTFLGVIERISNKSYQRKSWIQGKSVDFDEIVCLFVEDCEPILENYTLYNITESQYQVLKKFRDEFEVFSDENYWPPDFIDTPKWEKIMEMAKEVLKAFDYKQGS